MPDKDYHDIINPPEGAARHSDKMPPGCHHTLNRIGFFAGVRDAVNHDPNEPNEPERAKLELVCILTRMSTDDRLIIMGMYEMGYAYAVNSAVSDVEEYLKNDRPALAIDPAKALELVKTLLPHLDYTGGETVINELTKDGTYHG